MKCYEGEQPFVFVSYSHKDQIALKYIEALSRKQIRIWFDNGNRAGDDWADKIANHLIQSNAVLLFVSKNSCASSNVDNEIALSIKKNKRIIPVYIEDVIITPGMDIKIGRYHAINISEKSFQDAVEDIVNNIPKETIVTKKDPFYENKKWKLYLDEKIKPSGEVVDFEILAINENETKVLFKMPHIGPFELGIKINKCDEIIDDYFNEKGNENILLNLSIYFLLPYPLSGPDYDGLFSFVISEPLTDKICIKPISYKLISPKTDTYEPFLTSEEIKDHFGNNGRIVEELDKIFYKENLK